MNTHSIPFLWITDDDIEGILSEIRAIKSSGSDMFCVESRVHSDFCGPGWWHVMDAVEGEAQRLDMRFWLLDDKSYPTGFANGSIASDSLFRRWHIKADNVDIAGPLNNARLLLNSEDERTSEDEILYVFLLRLDKSGRVANIQNVSDKVRGDFLLLDVPDGTSRVVTIKKTRGGSEQPRENYIDMLNPDSVDRLIDAVYEPHYERYCKEKKPCALQGFFSDEPRFGNYLSAPDLVTANAYEMSVGILGAVYPWRADLEILLAERLPNYSSEMLLSLWYDVGDATPAFRCAYMDTITELYADNFSGKISSWCHERGLEYTGHIIEDMGAHTRTSCSAGHYFKAMQGLDYAGIDVVLHQIKPYSGDEPHIAPIAGGYAAPLFFDNTLAKLASSCARLDPQKNGKALCEIFGAYGWALGIDEMLYLVNHMLVRGINHFIPHAFSHKFPNTDCPPHFYARGNNPAYGAYVELNNYMNEMCRVLSGGHAKIDTAILYHAEADWSGRDYQSIDEVNKALLENQIDFDIVPYYNLTGGYKNIIVPYAEYLPDCVEKKINGIKGANILRLEKGEGSLSAAIERLKSNGAQTVKLTTPQKHLRAMRYIKDGINYYFFHNESIDELKTEVEVSHTGGYTVLDILNEQELTGIIADGKIPLNLPAGAAALIRIEKAANSTKPQKLKEYSQISLKTCTMRDITGQIIAETNDFNPRDLTETNLNFAGTVTLEGEATLPKNATLEIEYSGELLTVTIAGKQYKRITSPARINLNSQLSNSHPIKLELSTTLAPHLKDPLSKYSPIMPIAICKAIIKKQ